MALIKCTECNKKFSEYANACPNCGCPTKIVKKSIEIKKEQLYKHAVDIITNYKNVKELKRAKDILNSLNGFSDSIDKIKEINELLVIEEKKKIYNSAISIISNYKNTDDLYKAKDILNSLNGFSDSVNKIEEIENLLTYEEQKEKQKLYDSAINIIVNYKNINDLYKAKKIFKLLNGFKDAINKIDEIENLLIIEELKKQELYNRAINIISNYKSPSELYEAKEIFNSLNDFRDSSKKIEELEYLLNFENECQKVNVKQFAKIIVAVLIFIVISLCLFLLIDKKTNKINDINTNIHIEENDDFYVYRDLDYLDDSYMLILKYDSYCDGDICKPNFSAELFDNELMKIERILNADGYTKKECFISDCSYNNFLRAEEYRSLDYNNFFYKKVNIIKDHLYILDVSTMNYIYQNPHSNSALSQCKDNIDVEYNLLSNKGIFSCNSDNGLVYIKKNYNTNITSCYTSKTKPYMVDSLSTNHKRKIRIFNIKDLIVNDCKKVIDIENEMDNLKNEIVNYFDEASVDMSVIKDNYKSFLYE